MEVEPIVDDMQSDSGLILEPCLTLFDQFKVLIAHKVGLILSYLLLTGQLFLPEVLGIENVQSILAVEFVPTDQQDEHSELGLVSIGAGHLQISLLSLSDHTGGRSIMEDVGVRGRGVLGRIMDHLDVYLLVSEANFLLEEGPAERPLLQTHVDHRLQ